ncbi:TPA: type VI secretion system-associated protein TagO [Escherichia coli]|nr:type VI secretion system-associated protein TagO [Escherichia coli]
MSRLRVFRQTGWFIAGLMTGLPATAAPAEASSMAGVAVAVATTTPPDATATLQAIQSCRRESAALERLDCYDRLLAPLSPSGFDGALVKAGFVGEAWTRATEQEKRREGNTTELLVTQVPGERPTVVITTPAIGHVPPRPVLMFSCVDNITRMQVALMHPLDVHDIAVTLNADNRALRSHWFVRENGTLLESSRGLSGIDEIKQLFGAKTLTVDNPRSAQDASLDAFERFFKPDGILDTFYQQNLKLFIDNDLSLEDGDNNVIIREDIIAQLETAQKIRDIFFSKQNGLGTSFAVETVSLSGNKRRSVLNLDGQLVDYSQGRNYTAHLVWPNNMREGNESKLTLIGTSGNAPRSISFSGPWAQFRLFGAGQLTGVQDGNFTVRFSVDGGAMTYRVHTDTEDNPFSGGLFSQFGLSDTLY